MQKYKFILFYEQCGGSLPLTFLSFNTNKALKCFLSNGRISYSFIFSILFFKFVLQKYYVTIV